MNNENKTNINWLAYIYGDYYLNLYRLVAYEDKKLASYNKKRKKFEKTG